jgi:hypothetical protein
MFLARRIAALEPLNNCGMPFLAQWNTTTLYPLSFIWFPPLPGAGDFLSAASFSGRNGNVFSAARWSGHRLAAAVAGVAFAFNGLSLNSLVDEQQRRFGMDALGGAAGRSSVASGRTPDSARCDGCVQMLTGGPEIIFMTWCIAGRDVHR